MYTNWHERSIKMLVIPLNSKNRNSLSVIFIQTHGKTGEVTEAEIRQTITRVIILTLSLVKL